MHIVIKILSAPLLFLLTACVSSPGGYPVKDKEECTVGNLQEDAGMTPELHYRLMDTCIRAKNENRLLQHFALAGTVTWYDAKMSPGEKSFSRHQSLLKEYLNTLDRAERDYAWEVINRSFSNADSHTQICSYIEQIGSVRSRMMRFNREVWSEASSGYLHCNNVQELE